MRPNIMQQSEPLQLQQCGTTCYPGSLIILLSFTAFNTFIASIVIGKLAKVFFTRLWTEKPEENSRMPKRRRAEICIHEIGLIPQDILTSDTKINEMTSAMHATLRWKDEAYIREMEEVKGTDCERRQHLHPSTDEHLREEVFRRTRESTKAWKQALLKHNCDLLHRIGNASEQLPAVATFPAVPDPKTNGIQLTSVHAVVPVVITAQVHPTVMTTQHAATAATQQVPFHKPVTLHQEGLPALSEASIFQQGSNFQNSSGSSPITPLLPMDNAPHFANHFVQALPYNGSQYVVWPATTASQTVAISDMSMYSSPVCKNAPLNASISDHEVRRVDSELEDIWPHIVDSEYMPIPEPTDSEYILQKVDSQYLLSELDMRPA